MPPDAAKTLTLTVALQQVEKLRLELIKTDQVIKDSILENDAQNVGTLLEGLTRSFIPNFVSEIDHIFKISNLKKEIVEDEEQNQMEIEMDIKEEEDFEVFAEYSIDSSDGNQMHLNKQLGHNPQTPFIISGNNGIEIQKSITLFSSLCLKVPGTREALMGLKSSKDGYFVCPLCSPQLTIPTRKPFDFMRHVIRYHDHATAATLIPLPYVKIKKSESESNNEEIIPDEQLQAAAEAPKIPEIPPSTPTIPFVDSDERSVREFTSRCILVPGVRGRLNVHRGDDRLLLCPHCVPIPIDKQVKFPTFWKFLRHLIYRHEHSELIPLPFIRQRACQPRIMRIKKESSGPSNDQEKANFEK